MSNFIQELRRRNVFRVAGLYVGVSWILIEAASVLLPTFEAPEWALRWLVIITFIGFPVAVILAWVFEITERGVLRESEVDATTKPLVGGRQADFIAIGVLSVALIFSVYLNITRTTTVEPVEMEPTSVLIADFENATGDPLFDGLLEQALNIGIESAPNITAYLRNAAETVARQVSPDTKGISAQVARLIAVRQGIDLVLAGRIAQQGSGYELSLQAIDPQSGEVASETSRDAKAKDAVLAAVASSPLFRVTSKPSRRHPSRRHRRIRPPSTSPTRAITTRPSRSSRRRPKWIRASAAPTRAGRSVPSSSAGRTRRKHCGRKPCR